MPAALLVAGEIAKHFEADPLDEQLQTLKLAAGGTLSSAARDEAVQSAMALAESSRDVGRIELADAASLLAVDLAAKGKNLEQRKQAKQVRDTVLAYKKSADLVKEAEATLKTKPDDAAANLVVGKWHCFVLEDWAQGLPYLAKCSEPALAAAAKAEQDPQNSLAIADAWYMAVDKLQVPERIAAQSRAYEYVCAGRQDFDRSRSVACRQAGGRTQRIRWPKSSRKTPREAESERPSETRFLSKDIVRESKLTASRATRPGKFAVVEMPSATWLRSEGNEMILTAPEKLLERWQLCPTNIRVFPQYVYAAESLSPRRRIFASGLAIRISL